jgi:diadenosine tetraphosphatase ApaH/serine/threonine PP2A family protein phosphatase
MFSIRLDQEVRSLSESRARVAESAHQVCLTGRPSRRPGAVPGAVQTGPQVAGTASEAATCGPGLGAAEGFSPSHSQPLLLDFVVVAQVVGQASPDHRALAHHVEAVSRRQDHVGGDGAPWRGRSRFGLALRDPDPRRLPPDLYPSPSCLSLRPRPWPRATRGVPQKSICRSCAGTHGAAAVVRICRGRRRPRT